ncbi:LysR substrate-binding domain-containing protein [Sphingomonas sp. MG17]|uniref:LysR substrate-binding domain-containing protein n=1 Tax=Sphingomonas tagetis TaxID=2949092 RepID=A0A9X2HL71_9SPHN|nr:LysR family transcriptional regulator [Sphingomonas tagetis]MCP3730581.1 LysR substrate-binding domain-containing protein [Sphingomonas tagetis]
MNLGIVRTLVDILDAGNLSEAARRRGVTRSQISKELKELERQAGTMLVYRTTRHVAPTEAGRILYEHGHRMLAELRAAREAIQGLGDEIRGHVRISVPTALGTSHLGGALIAFQERHPEVTLRVRYSNLVENLVGDEVDIAVRILRDVPVSEFASEVSQIPWRLFAATSYLARRKPIAKPEDLADCDFLCTTGPPSSPTPLTLRLQSGRRIEQVAMKARMQSEHLPFLREAMLGGLGIAPLPDYAASDDVDRGAARVILPEWKLIGLDGRLFILAAQDRNAPRAVRALIDHLREMLGVIVDRYAADRG